MIIKKEILEQLSNELLLPFTGMEQDWDLEMSNYNRIDDFINYYKQNDLPDEKKLALMSLILASYDDFLNKNDLKYDDKWDEIKLELKSKKIIFDNLINYWSLSNETDRDDIFRITPLIREIKYNS